MMSGTFMNVIDAIDNPKSATPGDSSSLTPRKSESILPKRFASSSLEVNRLGNGVLFSLPETASWHIYNMNGHEMASANGKDFLWKEFRKGVYMVKATGTGFNFTKKVFLR